MKLKIERNLRICLFLVTVSIILQQQAKAQLGLVYKEFGIHVTPKKCNDTLTFTSVKDYPNSKLVIYLKDCKGACFFELYDRIGSIKVTGAFSNAIDTLLEYNFSKELGMQINKKTYRVSIVKYFRPLKKGVWNFYDDNHKIIRSEEWNYLTNDNITDSTEQ